MESSTDMKELRAEFRRTALAFLQQLKMISPPETFYAVLFGIGDQAPEVWPIAASEESLTRLALEYKERGYRASAGDDPVGLLRAGLRWDAPGDDMTGWYWAEDDIEEPLNERLDDVFGEDEEFYDTVRSLCLDALQELDQEGAFGTGADRAQLVIGVSNVEEDFEDFLPELARVNPPEVMERLRQQLQEAEKAWEVVKRPK